MPEGIDHTEADEMFQFEDAPADEAGDEDELEEEADDLDEVAEDDALETTEDEDDLVEVRIKGQVHRVTPALAAAMQDQTSDQRARDGRLGGENAQLRERLARIEGQLSATSAVTDATPALQPPDPALALTDMPAYQRELLAYTDGLRAQDKAEIRAEYEEDVRVRTDAHNTEAAQAAWADGFFAQHPEFNRDEVRVIVADVFKRNEGAILSLPDTAAQQELLATLSRERWANLIKNPETQPTTPPKLATSRPAPRKRAAPEDSAPRSMAGGVRAIRARMRGDTPATG